MNNLDYEEIEMMIKDELDRRQEEKRWRNYRGNNFDHSENKKSGGLIKIPCCLIVLIVMALAIVLIYYVYIQIRDPIISEWQKDKAALEQLPQKVEELKDHITEALGTGKIKIEEANYTLENIEQKIDSIKNAYNKTRELTEDLKDLSNYTNQILQ